MIRSGHFLRVAARSGSSTLGISAVGLDSVMGGPCAVAGDVVLRSLLAKGPVCLLVGPADPVEASGGVPVLVVGSVVTPTGFFISLRVATGSSLITSAAPRSPATAIRVSGILMPTLLGLGADDTVSGPRTVVTTCSPALAGGVRWSAVTAGVYSSCGCRW